MNNNNELQKMIFIFNALNDGWVVRKLDHSKFEFIKDKEKMTKEIYLEDYLEKFIKSNMNLEKISSLMNSPINDNDIT